MRAEARLKLRVKDTGSLLLIHNMTELRSSHQKNDPKAIPAGRKSDPPIVLPSDAASAIKLRIVAGLAMVRRKEENML
ncbi:hypothetical protein D3C80_1589550 [compost metagenome]